jgi:non-specific serine/threonine protein kinase
MDVKIAAPLSALPVGAVLQEYEITGVIGEGGFGIVYRARDIHLNREVAIKEYMPPALASRNADLSIAILTGKHKSTFDIGLRSFIAEAKLMAQFKHPVLIDILRFWQQNQTAYMAMPFYDGPTLKALIASGEVVVNEKWVRALLEPLLDGLARMHETSCYHRDISPDNILVLSESGSPILLDFGAARRIAAELTQGITVILKPGYAPVEQYTDDPSILQGPWTDIYGLAAVCRHAITSKSLVASVTRLMRDPLEPLESLRPPGFSIEFLRAIDKGLAVRPEDRPQSLDEFRALLAAGKRDLLPSAREAAISSATPPAPIAPSAPSKPELILVTKPSPAEVHARKPEAVAEPPPMAAIPAARQAAKFQADETVILRAVLGATARGPTPAKPVLPELASPYTPPPTPALTTPTPTPTLTKAASPKVATDSAVPTTTTTTTTVVQPNTAAVSPLQRPRTRAANYALIAIAGLIIASGAAVYVLLSQTATPAIDALRDGAPNVDIAAVNQAPQSAAASPSSAGAQTPNVATGQASQAPLPASSSVKNTPEPPINASTEAAVPPALSASKPVVVAAVTPPLPNPSKQLPLDPSSLNRSGATTDIPAVKPLAIVGTLQLDIRPWGEVSINGQSRGVSPPMKQLSLPEGKYDVSVTNPGSQPYFRVIEVFVGKTVSIRHEFQSP